MSSSSPAITTTMLILTVMFAAVATTFEVSAKSSVATAPPPVDCSTVVLSMSDCLSCVTNGSTTKNPEGTCCSGLKQVLKTSPDCLCQAFQQSAQFGVVLNVTKALALPYACKVHAPSVTNCGLSLSPAGAPIGVVVDLAGSPFSSIANAPSYGMGSSETSPSTAPSKMASSPCMGVSVHFITVSIVATFCWTQKYTRP